MLNRILVLVLILNMIASVLSAQSKNEKAIQLHMKNGNYKAAIKLINEEIISNPSNRGLTALLNEAAEKDKMQDRENTEKIRRENMEKAEKYLEDQRQRKMKLDGLKGKYNHYIGSRQYFYAFDTLDQMTGIDIDDSFIENKKTEMVNTASNWIKNAGVDSKLINYAQAFLSYADSDYKRTIEFINTLKLFDSGNAEIEFYIKKVTSLRKLEKVSKEIIDQYNAGKKAYDRKSYNEAYYKFQNVIELYNKNSTNDSEFVAFHEDRIKNASYYLAKIGKPTKADPVSKPDNTQKETIVIDPQKSDEMYQNGMNAYNQGRLKEAIALWNGALRYNPNNTKARSAIDRAQKELGK